MKIKSFIILVTAFIALTAGTANANLLFDIYAGGTFGVGGNTIFVNDAKISKSSQSYGGILGFDLPFVRLEGEYNYINGDKLAINLAMANMYFKLPTPVVKPYIGAGIGTTFDSKYEPSDITTIDIKDTTAYQGMLGVTLDLPVIPIKFDIEGRVLYAQDIYKVIDDKAKFLHYEGRVKLRYVF